MDDLLPLLEEVCALAALPNATVADRMAAASMLLSLGFVIRARAILLTLLTDAPVGQNTLLDLCRRILGAESLLHAHGDFAGIDHPGEIMLAPAPAAAHLLLLFPGIGGRFWGVNSFPLVSRPGLHLVFLRLRSDRLYLAGIDGLGDSYETCLSSLRCIIAALAKAAGAPTMDVHCLGHSFGGYAALRFGLDLGARSVLAFSAPTTLDITPDRHYQLAINPNLALLNTRAPDMAADLRPLYEAHPEPPSVVLCYGDQHAEDLAAAEHMAGLACVSLEPIPMYAGHDSLWETIQRETFEPLVDRLLASRKEGLPF